MPRPTLFDFLPRLALGAALALSAAACGDSGGSEGDGPPAPAGGLLLGDGGEMQLTTLWSVDQVPDVGQIPDPRDQAAILDLSPAQLAAFWEPGTFREPTDLDFDPVTGRLWVTLREPYEGQLCQAGAPQGCAALEGSTLELLDPTGTDTPVVEWRRDTNAWHFMRRPTSLAFGIPDPANPSAGAWFATCGEFRTGNTTDDPNDFMGPAHWTSDLSIYPFTGPGGNGSHLDMLHATPFCMGVAHDVDAVYWVFNGNVGAIDRYDFGDPHVPGGADHSDGIIHRYAEGAFTYAPEIMSHLDLHDASGWLYVADPGAGRVARLDTASGTRGPRFEPIYEPLEDAATFPDATVETFVDGLGQPSGLAVVGDEVYVADHETSMLLAYDLEGELLNEYDTGLPPGSLAGIAAGPDERLYLVDMLAGAVYRLEPAN